MVTHTAWLAWSRGAACAKPQRSQRCRHGAPARAVRLAWSPAAGDAKPRRGRHGRQAAAGSDSLLGRWRYHRRRGWRGQWGGATQPARPTQRIWRGALARPARNLSEAGTVASLLSCGAPPTGTSQAETGTPRPPPCASRSRGPVPRAPRPRDSGEGFPSCDGTDASVFPATQDHTCRGGAPFRRCWCTPPQPLPCPSPLPHHALETRFHCSDRFSAISACAAGATQAAQPARSSGAAGTKRLRGAFGRRREPAKHNG